MNYKELTHQQLKGMPKKELQKVIRKQPIEERQLAWFWWNRANGVERVNP